MARHSRQFALISAAVVLVIGTALVGSTRASAGAIGSGVVVIETVLAYQSGEAAGTGMVLTSSGEVMTNNHVIRGATTIRVVVPGTGKSYSARVVGYDVSDDVAVLQLENASNLGTVSLGDSSAVHRGQVVTAVGNAGGAGSLSTVAGIVTGLSKAITASDGEGDVQRLTGLIETNAPVVSGDSGGPLQLNSGKVVGMTTAASAKNFSFLDTGADDAYAIPIAKAVGIAKQIWAGTSTARIHIGGTPFLGVALQVGGGGALIGSVGSGSPAAKAGLRPGDTITRIDGHPTATSSTVKSRLLLSHPGDRATVTYRDTAGATRTVTVTLASGPPQ